MGLLKIPLIFVLVLAVLYTRAANHRRSKINRRNNVDVDSSKNCFCFPKSVAQAPLARIIDPNNKGLERLIVYLYRDYGSQVIKMYTPAKEKQNLIPDIPFETGDSLDPITTDTVVDVFNSSPHKVFNINVTYVPEVINQPDIVTEKDLYNSKEDNTYWLINNENPISVESAPFAISPSDVPNQSSEGDILPYHPIHTDSEEIVDAWLSHNDHNLPHYNHIDDDPDVHISVVNEPLSYDNRINSQSLDTILNSTLFNYNRNVNTKNYITFDKWFADQLAKFNALDGPTSANTIDIYTLKALTEKTLQENNIYVSIDGVLTDAHGTVMDVSNLMLRPILIGDLVAYQNVLKETNKFKLPTNSPYLEALLVTLVNPPKVLGIIPLGLAILPSQPSISSLPAVHTIPYVNSAEEPSAINYGGRRILPGYLKVPNTDRVVDNKGIQYVNRRALRMNLDYILRKAKARRPIKGGRPHKASKNDVLNDSKPEDSKKPERPKIRNMLKNFYEILMGGKEGNNDQSNDYDSSEDISSEDVEDKHDFRIIGGNAATSSGTPINNKGRSGIIM